MNKGFQIPCQFEANPMFEFKLFQKNFAFNTNLITAILLSLFCRQSVWTSAAVYVCVGISAYRISYSKRYNIPHICQLHACADIS